MHKIGIIGDRESVLGFMAIGFTVFEADNADKAGEIVDKLANDNYAVIFITQTYAAQIYERLAKYSSVPIPAIIPIPDKNGGGYGESILKHAVERAVGADILFKE